MLSSAVLHILNWVFHCSTLTPELHRTIAFFLNKYLNSIKYFNKSVASAMQRNIQKIERTYLTVSQDSVK